MAAMADSPAVEAGAGTSAGAGADNGGAASAGASPDSGGAGAASAGASPDASPDSGGAAGREASVTCARVRAYTWNVSVKVRSNLFFARRLFYRLARRLLPP
jgi:hypothetical protein